MTTTTTIVNPIPMPNHQPVNDAAKATSAASLYGECAEPRRTLYV
jgi:hypothetical protein